MLGIMFYNIILQQSFCLFKNLYDHFDSIIVIFIIIHLPTLIHVQSGLNK